MLVASYNSSRSSGQLSPNESPPMLQNEVRVSAERFRAIALSSLRSVLFLLRVAKAKATPTTDREIGWDHRLLHDCDVPDHALEAFLQGVIDDTFDAPGQEGLAAQASAVLRRLISASNVAAVVSTLSVAGQLKASSFEAAQSGASAPAPSLIPRARLGAEGELKISGHQCALHEQKEDGPHDIPDTVDQLQTSHFTYSVVDAPEYLAVHWAPELGDDFFAATCEVARQFAEEQVEPSFIDFVVLHIAYHLLEGGQTLPDVVVTRYLGTPGFSDDPHPRVVLADPGNAHVFLMAVQPSLSRGVTLHVERPRDLRVEAHRELSLTDLGRTRMHAGPKAPTTYFVGRATGEGAADAFVLADATTATLSAVNAAFSLGAAECMIAMDGLRASQMVAYMRGVAMHAMRKHLQHLSASFQIDGVLVDDLVTCPDGAPRELREPMTIARRLISLCAIGGFNSCIWETASGASGTRPRLQFANVLELVHRAHSVGLGAQVSTALTECDTRELVYTGVDRIGSIAELYKPQAMEAVDAVLSARDDAVASARGQAAHLLARLDRMYFEGSLSEAEGVLRTRTFHALRTVDEEAIDRLLCTPIAAAVLALPSDQGRPYVERARRLLNRARPLGVPGPVSCESRLVGRGMEELVEKEDELALYLLIG